MLRSRLSSTVPKGMTRTIRRRGPTCLAGWVTKKHCQVVNIVADHLGFKRMGDVKVSHEAKKFTLNDQQFDYAGSAHRTTGEIVLYPDVMQPASVSSVSAHEIMHVKWQRVFDAYRAEEERQRKDDRGGNKWIMRPDGELREEYRADYPVYARLWNLIEVQKLSEDDGITDYSRDWWKAWHVNTADSQQAVHETLAEMARLDWEGVLPRLIWFEGIEDLETLV